MSDLRFVMWSFYFLHGKQQIFAIWKHDISTNILKGKSNAYSLWIIFVSKIYCLCKWICVWNVKYSYLNTLRYISFQKDHDYTAFRLIGRFVTITTLVWWQKLLHLNVLNWSIIAMRSSILLAVCVITYVFGFWLFVGVGNFVIRLSQFRPVSI